ncbi:MAG: hypothetical protein VZR00_00105 [Lachnospiraceae bacterium]|nr:hypothetical protein [Lachnospiraceae bacterium]MEE3460279.1 hypothetical protein [Lachnospiraceae bacterium]
MSVSRADQELFREACDKILHKNILTGSIGTLSEKTMHAVLKNFYEPDTDHQEIPIGNFVADIFRDGEIIEIQTRSLDKLRNKLKAFLPKYPVTVVHPVVFINTIHWIDPETGGVSKGRRSNSRGSILHEFRELYKIKMFLKDPNLTICFPVMNADTYRTMNKNPNYRKRHTVRYDTVPTELIDEVILKAPLDYASLIPDEVPEEFTSAQFAKCTRLTSGTANTVLNIMRYMEAVELTGKQGRAYLYSRKH